MKQKCGECFGVGRKIGVIVVNGINAATDEECEVCGGTGQVTGVVEKIDDEWKPQRGNRKKKKIIKLI
jgi:hypothetical protein